MKDTAFARRKISDNAARTIGVYLQIRSAGFRMVGDCDLEFGSLTSENRVDPGEAQFQSNQVALALVHRNETKAGQQKCQSERQVIIVVHRAEQHRKSHQCEYETYRSRQYVNAARMKFCGRAICTLAFSGPAFRFGRDGPAVRLGFKVLPRNRGHVD
jgi:hypothetical protein